MTYNTALESRISSLTRARKTAGEKFESDDKARHIEIEYLTKKLEDLKLKTVAAATA